MESEKKDNSGSALLLTLTILTFLSILGSMTLTGGLLCRKLIRRYAMTEESVYVLEQSMEEVRAGMEVLVEEEQKKSYGEILGLLYRDSVKENDEANTLLREMVYEGTRERLLDKGTESLPPELEWTASEPEEDENGDLLVRDFCLRGAAEPEGVCVLVTADVRIHLPRISFFQEASGSTLQREEGELVTLEHWRRGR
ncbi:MAG: hypothetical protein J6D13_08985 [Clostridium sp.]|nr:hypothetical protein [Clostridium sp.]